MGYRWVSVICDAAGVMGLREGLLGCLTDVLSPVGSGPAGDRTWVALQPIGPSTEDMMLSRFQTQRKQRGLAALTAVSLLLPPAQLTMAANHPNSRMATANVIDLTANVDWDYDTTTPTQAGTGGVTLTKDVVSKSILREVARGVFLMTEGRHRIGTVYLYKNGRFGQNVDIQIINKSERSYASVSRWQQPDGSSFNFLAMDNKADNLRDYARVITHELGHYVYGFFDEYREEGKALGEPSSPSGVDFTRNSIMNDHTSFTRLSVADDYQGTASANNTAQARAYATDRVNLRGGSHWEMLTRDPANDPAEGKAAHEGRRVWFDAFKGINAPSKVSDLTRYFGVFCNPQLVQAFCGTGDSSRDQLVPTTDRIGDLTTYNNQLFAKSGGSVGVDAADGTVGSAFENFKVVFVDSPSTDGKAILARVNPLSHRLAVTARAASTSGSVAHHVIVIDRSLPAAVFDEARQAALSLVEQGSTGSQWAIVASPSASSSPVIASTSADTGRDALIAAVQGLTRADGKFDVTAAFAQAQLQLSAGRKDADSAVIELLTSQGSTVSKDLSISTRQARTAVNAIGLRLPTGSSPTNGGELTLEALAKATGGNAFNARDAEQAIKLIERAERKASGEVFSLLATNNWSGLAAGSSQAATSTVTSYDKVVGAHWNFDPADKNALSFKLVTPAGTFSTLSAASNLDQGYALIEVDNSTQAHNGAVRAEIAASANVKYAVGLDLQSESQVMVTASLYGGTVASKLAPVLHVQFAGNAPVAKAKVLATIYRDSDGTAVLSDLVLADDGKGVDNRADDGRYAISLSGLLPAGDYTIAVRAETTADSVFQPNQVFSIGSTVPVQPIGAGVVRVDELEVTLEAGATGVLAADSGAANGGGSGGGGCTVVDGQHDIGLSVLMAAALMGLWLRRRHQRKVNAGF